MKIWVLHNCPISLTSLTKGRRVNDSHWRAIKQNSNKENDWFYNLICFYLLFIHIDWFYNTINIDWSIIISLRKRHLVELIGVNLGVPDSFTLSDDDIYVLVLGQEIIVDYSEIWKDDVVLGFDSDFGISEDHVVLVVGRD